MSAGGEHFRDHVLKEARLHPRRADAADLLLIHEQTARRALYCFRLEHGAKCSIGADAVILPVAEHHAAVKAELACTSRRNKRQLRRVEVLLGNVIMLLEERENPVLDGFLVVFFQRITADEHIQLLPLDDL